MQQEWAEGPSSGSRETGNLQEELFVNPWKMVDPEFCHPWKYQYVLFKD